MKIENFKEKFYGSAMEALKEHDFHKTQYEDRDGKRIFEKDGKLYVLKSFEHFNGYPYSLTLTQPK